MLSLVGFWVDGIDFRGSDDTGEFQDGQEPQEYGPEWGSGSEPGPEWDADAQPGDEWAASGEPGPEWSADGGHGDAWY